MDVNSIEEMKNNGPGEYNIKYNYNGRNYYFNVKVGDVNNTAGINVNGFGIGQVQDGKFYDEYLSNYNTNSIDVRYQYGHQSYGSGGNEALSNFLSEIANSYGLDKSNTTLSGFSASSMSLPSLAATYAETTDASGFTAMIIEDTTGGTALPLNSEQRDILINHNVTLLNVHATNSSDMFASEYKLNKYKGINLIDLQFVIKKSDTGYDYSGHSHVIPNDVFAKYGITNLGNGTFDFTKLPTIYNGRNTNGDVTIEYIVKQYYIDENGDYVSKTLTLDELNKTLGCGPYYGGIIQSDNEYLSQGLTNINTKLTSLANTELNLSVTSTTSVPLKEVELLNSLKNSINILCEKLKQELITFGKVGNRFYDLNLKLEEQTVNLMSSFLSPLASKSLDIPLNDFTAYDYNLEQLIADYNSYVENLQLKIPEYDPFMLRDKDMTESVYPVTAEDLDRLFAHWAERRYNPNSKLLGMGSAFISASKETGIDPLTLVGICGIETGRGGDGNQSNWIENNNFFGIKYGDNGYWGETQLYDNPADGIMAGAQRIKNFYYDKHNFKSIHDLDAGGYDGDGYDKYSDNIGYIMDESLDYIIETKNPKIELPESDTNLTEKPTQNDVTTLTETTPLSESTTLSNTEDSKDMTIPNRKPNIKPVTIEDTTPSESTNPSNMEDLKDMTIPNRKPNIKPVTIEDTIPSESTTSSNMEDLKDMTIPNRKPNIKPVTIEDTTPSESTTSSNMEDLKDTTIADRKPNIKPVTIEDATPSESTNPNNTEDLKDTTIADSKPNISVNPMQNKPETPSESIIKNPPKTDENIFGGKKPSGSNHYVNLDDDNRKDESSKPPVIDKPIEDKPLNENPNITDDFDSNKEDFNLEPNDNNKPDLSEEVPIINDEEIKQEPIIEIPDEGNNESNPFKTIATLSAVGAAVGVSAYTANKVINNNADDNYYQYENKKRNDEEKQESLEEQYKEFYTDKGNLNDFGGE